MPGPNTNFSQLTAVTKRYFLPKLADNIFLGNPLLARADKKGWKKLIDGGDKIVIPLEYAINGVSDWYSGADTLNVADGDTFTAAELEWKQLYAPITISRRDELRNMGAAQVVDFVKAKVKNAEKTIRKNLSEGLYNAGSDADAIVGLRAWVDAASTVGGISQSGNSWWQGKEDTTTTTLSIAAVQTQFNSASEDGEQPTVLVSTKAVYNSYYALLQPQQRFTDAETAKGGFSNLLFNGVTWLSDTNVPSGHLFGLNEAYLHLFTHKEENARMTDFDEPINQNVKVAKIYWMGALGSSNNRYHFKFDGLTA